MNVEQQVRTRAYEIWEREGYPDGRALVHWEQAAKEVEQLLHAAVTPVIVAPVIAAPAIADAVKAAPAKKSSRKVAAAPAAKASRRGTARAHQSLN
jgi:hypothetical protein